MTVVPASAGGISAVPGVITVPDALRGSTIFRQVTLMNNTGVASTFTFTFEGTAADWVTAVDADDRTTPIYEALDSDGTGVRVLLRIDVPEDAANGRYVADFTAIIAAPDTDEGVGVGLAIGVTLKLDVIGTEIMAATISDVSIKNTEVGVPARIRVAIQNEGNITVVPTFSVEILQDRSVVSNTTTSGQRSYPGEQDIFEVLWDTSNAEPGDYVARVAINFGDVDLGTKELDFTVYPAGALARSVVFSSLEVDGEPRAGGFTRLTATVDNPGQVDVSVIVVGELTKNDTLVSSFESLSFPVRASEVVRIPIAIELLDEGDYDFTARVVYEDVESDPLTVTFTALSAPVEASTSTDIGVESGSGAQVATIALVLVVLTALLGVGAWLLTRKRNTEDSSEKITDQDADPDKQTAAVGSED